MHASSGRYRLQPGISLALGSGRPHIVQPHSPIRMWVACADENFWRFQMSWFLPDRNRVRAGLHPSDWFGEPVVIDIGDKAMRNLEPIWRELSSLHDRSLSPERISTRTVELLARWSSRLLPAFVSPCAPALDPQELLSIGRLTDPAAVGHVARAIAVLKDRLQAPWTIDRLAREVALSRTHLHRVFLDHTGIPPMRFLTELRLTSFTRLIDETDVSVAQAAAKVGWMDPRVASGWFQRRHGMTPSEYRARRRNLGRNDIDNALAVVTDVGQ